MATIVWNPAQAPFGGTRVLRHDLIPAQPDGSSATAEIREPQSIAELSGEAAITVVSSSSGAAATTQRVAHFPFQITDATSDKAAGVVSLLLRTGGPMVANVGIGRRDQNPLPLISTVAAGFSLLATIDHLQSHTRVYEFTGKDSRRLKSPATPGAIAVGQLGNSDTADFTADDVRSVLFEVEGDYVLTMALAIWARGSAERAGDYVREATGESRIYTKSAFNVAIDLF